MRLNLVRQVSPSHVLDILPETEDESQMILEFLGKIISMGDLNKVSVSPIENGKYGGICLWFE